jgi:hypothetical protein
MRLLFLLCLTTFIACTTTPPDWNIEGEELKSNDGAWTVRWRTEPTELPLNEPFIIEAEIQRVDGAALPDGLLLEVDAAMPEHRHGMNRLPRMIALGGGLFRAEGMLFHMEGRWELYFDVTEEELTERSQTEVFLE